MAEPRVQSAQEVAQRLVLDLARRRQEALANVKRIEAQRDGAAATYDRGLAYAYSVAMNAIERDFS